MNCRVCNGAQVARIFQSAPRSIIAVHRPIDAAVNVWACSRCGHSQSDDIDFAKFYDKDYQFQLSSHDYDELHAIVGGKNIYRTDLQARIAIERLDLPQGAKVLDYGAAKAATLRRFYERRPDVVPHVFDVTNEYTALWSEWIADDRQAAYKVPVSWHGSFDCVLNFFVLEHVAKPNEVVKEISDLLAPDGVFMFAVPNPLENYSDFVVIEHVSHFTKASLGVLMRQNGLAIEYYSSTAFSGAHIVIARKQNTENWEVEGKDATEALTQLKRVAEFWGDSQSQLIHVARKNADRPSAIYGAGVYGCYTATRLEGRANLRCFVDRNPHLWGNSEFGIPIVGPDRLPDDVSLIFAGLNPFKAHDILDDVPEWRGRNVEIVFLGEP